jgi:hypothetical protein
MACGGLRHDCTCCSMWTGASARRCCEAAGPSYVVPCLLALRSCMCAPAEAPAACWAVACTTAGRVASAWAAALLLPLGGPVAQQLPCNCAARFKALHLRAGQGAWEAAARLHALQLEDGGQARGAAALLAALGDPAGADAVLRCATRVPRSAHSSCSTAPGGPQAPVTQSCQGESHAGCCSGCRAPVIPARGPLARHSVLLWQQAVDVRAGCTVLAAA